MTEAALQIVREEGSSALTARALAARLGCSVKPVFSLFKNMEEVQQAVLGAAHDLYQGYLEEDMAGGKYPPYKASGMAYIRFAKEEKELLSCSLCVTAPGRISGKTEKRSGPFWS